MSSKPTKPAPPKTKDRPSDDFYPTPEYVTRALLKREHFNGTIWEPACGAGDMSEVLESHGYDVRSTDLNDHGYGAAGVDFLTQTAIDPRIGAIVTNPPFICAEQFIARALVLNPGKVALFLRLSFIEGKRRYRQIFRDHAPARIWAFSGRVTLLPKGNPGGRPKNGFMAFAWYVWDDRRFNRSTELGWIGDE